VKFYDHCREQRFFQSMAVGLKFMWKGILLHVYQYETRLTLTANHSYRDPAIDMEISLSSNSRVTRNWLPLLSTPAFVS